MVLMTGTSNSRAHNTERNPLLIRKLSSVMDDDRIDLAVRILFMIRMNDLPENVRRKLVIYDIAAISSRLRVGGR